MSSETDILSRRGLLRGKLKAEVPTTALIQDNCLSLNAVECRLCQDNCPEGAINFRPKLGGTYEPSIDASLCTSCSDCIPVCPVSAISIDPLTEAANV